MAYLGQSKKMTVSPPTVDGSEILHLLKCMKPCKQWEKLSTSTSAGFLSTVFLNQFQGSFGPLFSTFYVA